MSFKLQCSKCNKEYPLDTKLWRCIKCEAPFKLQNNNIKKAGIMPYIDPYYHGIWRYKKLIPFSESPITLGEGATPTITPQSKLSFKLEYFSPSGSFKDRGATVSITRAKAIGIKTIVEDSTGNAGIAASVYSGLAKIQARVYMPSDAPPAKKAIVKACGGVIIECKSREEASERAINELTLNDLYIGHSWDPFYIEGMKTVAFEIFESGCNPESIILPVASGTLLLGLYKGYQELTEMKLLKKCPRLYAVQGEEISPIYQKLHGPLIEKRSSSIADGIRIANPPRKDEIINALKLTKGDAFVVNDSEIINAAKSLWRMGILAEPSSAAAYAAYLRTPDFFGKSLIPITGTGIKTLDLLKPIYR